ncbi:MAG: primosomal protein N' [Desulfosalsimonas sp.]|uniref:replication restart helicase PriA n=1 Tax=Desulfosalsimonas sp. TaxID=3073848 RepID=UPI00397063FB
MPTRPKQVEVAVAMPVFGTYTYQVPPALEGLVEAGKRVLVPFGSRRITGYVLGEDSRDTADTLRPIDDVIDDDTPVFPAEMIPFFRWIADYYIHPIGEVISDALPGGINPSEYAVFSPTARGRRALEENTLAAAEHKVLARLTEKACRWAALCKNAGEDIPRSLLEKMRRQGLIEKQHKLQRQTVRTKTERWAALTDTSADESGLSEPKARIIKHLRAHGQTPVAALKKIVPTAAAHVRDLAKKEIVCIVEQEVYRDPFGDPVTPDTPPRLTGEQQRVVREAAEAVTSGFCTYLLAGVTGSGKTEVYMHIAAHALEHNRTALVLVPEIALISEIERRFRARFGARVAVLHSGLSAGERFDQWMRIARGESPVVIGARSAVFAPLTQPGVIIVDEEHDTSYKQEGRLHYNARDMAVVRAKLADGAVVLGSATPSVQSVYNVAAGKFRELNLTRRIHRQAMPEVSVVDLRQHRGAKGARRFITPPLKEEIRATLGRGEQVLLFLNRRGFASYPVCAQCGEALKCRHCDITLTLHKKANIYKCHMCGYFRAAVSKCDTCGSASIKQLGTGTEKLEDAVATLFPEARVARMDKDTINRRGALLKILKNLREQKIDILVGTQMVAKGHDFPNITLVGIICADLSLSFPDFRAGEMTFQVLAQVAGRAGRGTAPGKVVLQTYSPNHFAIKAARIQDFMSFYNQEIKFRKALQYPPFARMTQLKISGRDKTKTRQQAEDLGRLCLQIQNSGDPNFKQIQVLGPIESPVTRIAGRYRWQILLKAPEAGSVRKMLNLLRTQNPSAFPGREVHTVIDVDPFFMM